VGKLKDVGTRFQRGQLTKGETLLALVEVAGWAPLVASVLPMLSMPEVRALPGSAAATPPPPHTHTHGSNNGAR